MIAPDQLPYTENGGYAPKAYRYLLIIITVALLVAKLRGFYVTTWQEVGLPLAVLGGLYLVHHAVRNAVHGAIRDADRDDHLDRLVVESVAQEAKRTLTPSVLARKIDETL